MSAGTQDPREGMGSRFICHLQASRQADLPQGEEENVWGEGGHGGQKLAAWNLPFLQFSGGGPLASPWPVLWTKQAGGRQCQLSSAGHQEARSEGPWSAVRRGWGTPGPVTREHHQISEAER